MVFNTGPAGGSATGERVSRCQLIRIVHRSGPYIYARLRRNGFFVGAILLGIRAEVIRRLFRAIRSVFLFCGVVASRTGVRPRVLRKRSRLLLAIV